MLKHDQQKPFDFIGEFDSRNESASDCEFCRVIRKQVPAMIVLDDAVTLAFLDKRPIFLGHCLLIPKIHCATLVELPDDTILPLFRNAKLLSHAVEIALEAEGTFVAINNRVSQSVPHLHIHVVPRRKKDGLKGFFWPRQSYKNQEEMLATRKLIEASLRELHRVGGWMPP